MSDAPIPSGGDPLGAIISGGATLLGGWMQSSAQDRANKTAINLANTAHQREVKDLKAAGLNPLLSGTGGKGAETPTIQASTGMGNAMQHVSSSIIQFMEGQQQIELARANAEKARADAQKTQAEIPWVAPTSAMNIQQGRAHATEMTQATTESVARTATIQAMRDPQVAEAVNRAALTAQQTKTEEQRTAETKAAADVAKQLWGARASEAATIAAQAATYYNKFFAIEQQQKVDNRDLANELLKNDIFQRKIENILQNEYGRMQELSKVDPYRMFGPTLTKMHPERKVIE